MYILSFIRGFFMAVADSVPGVSGGTIAFVLGFYDKFIHSIHELIHGTKESRKEAFIFLSKIGIGWIVGMILSVLFIASIFEEHIYAISSLFLGLIIVAIPLIIKEEKNELIGKYKYLGFTLAGIFAVSLITYFNPLTNGTGTTTSLSSLSLGIIIFVFAAGMIAISAMVLPGISGSTILLILGLYAGIINAVKELIQFNFSYFPVVFVFGLGILAGVFVTIKIVNFLLTNYRAQTIYTIVGLMIGSLYAVVMGPLSLEVPKDAMSFSTFSILFFLIGGGLIIGLEQLKKYMQHHTKE